MNKSKTVFPIGDHYEVVIYPKEDEFRLRDRIYEHFFTNVYPYMDIQEQEKISWNRDFFRFEKEDSKDDMQALEFLVKQQFGGDKLLPSWCLSRLWYLTNGNIVDAIASLHEPYSGELDGGVISISVLIEKEEIPLVLFQWEASADEGYLLAKLLDWSPQVTEEDALVILKNMNHWFLSDMNLLSVCSITIHNPEEKGYPWEYGYDGKKLLRINTNKVLEWYDSAAGDEISSIVRSALKAMEEHPLHHLERGIRNQLLFALQKYWKKKAIDYPSGMLWNRICYLPHEVAGNAIKIWKQTWPEETKIKEMELTLHQMLCDISREEEKEHGKKIEEYETYVRSFIKGTWVRGMDHKRHYYGQSLAGLSVVHGMKEIHKQRKLWEIFWEINRKKKETSSITNETNKSIPSLIDIDLPTNFWEEDMHFYAACGAADGLPYEMEGFEKGDPLQFYRFWTWWLLEVVAGSL